MPTEPIKLKPQVRIRPLSDGSCKMEIDAIVDWATAIEMMKLLGHFDEIATMEQSPLGYLKSRKRPLT
jgi:hypothetical protein